jgi:Na+-driven multidrug efflux pump
MRQTVAIAWPLLINAILHQSMVVIDTLLVAPLGSISVAALGVSSTFLFFCLGVQFAFANGTQLILARYMGAEDHAKIHNHFLSGLVINLSVTLVFSTLLFFFPTALLHRIINDADVVQLVATYLRIGSATLLFASASQIIIARFNAARMTRIPLAGLGLEIPANLLVSLLLIHGIPGFIEGLGLAGAAWGSLAAMAVRTGYLVIRAKQLLLNQNDQKTERITFSTVKAHSTEASPIALNYLTLTTGIMVYQLLFAQLPVLQYSAIVLLLPWVRMGGQVGTTWGQATSIQISRLIGKNKHNELKDFLNNSLRFTVGLSLLVSSLFLALSFLLPKIYTNTDPKTLATLWMIAPLFVLLPLVRIFNTVLGQSLRALRKSRYVLKVHVMTLWGIALPICAILVFFDASVFWVFSILILEEILKTWPFLSQTLKLKRA